MENGKQNQTIKEILDDMPELVGTPLLYFEAMVFQTCPWGTLLQVGSNILTPSHQGDQFGPLFSVYCSEVFLWHLGVNSEANANVVEWEFDRGYSTRHSSRIWIWSWLLHETFQMNLNLIVATPRDIAAGFEISIWSWLLHETLQLDLGTRTGSCCTHRLQFQRTHAFPSLHACMQIFVPVA